MIVLLGAALGAILGSYLATLAMRWCRGESASRGRSRCDGCGSVIPAHGLIPIVSFLVRRGRCPQCGARIDPLHPVGEIIGAVIGALSLALLPLGEAIAGMVFGWALMLLALLDVRCFWLPDRVTLPLGVAGIGAAFLGVGPPPGEALIGAAAGFGALWLVAWSYRRVRGRTGLGGGDPKLMAAIGAWCGWMALPMILLAAALLGLVLVAILRARGEAVGAMTRLPFGTLLALAAWPAWMMQAV